MGPESRCLDLGGFPGNCRERPLLQRTGFQSQHGYHSPLQLPNGNDLIFNYLPEPAGGQATGQTYTSSYTTTSMAGKSASITYTVGYALEGGVSAQFIAALGAKIKVSATYAYTNGWSSTITNGTSQSANFTIYPPLSTDNYVGPTAIQVWKDNIFGTFMFYPEN